jgi:hypothetical protein
VNAYKANFFLFLFVVTNSSNASDVTCKKISSDWSLFSDNIALFVTYNVVGEVGRKFEIGTGVSVSGKPRGAKKTFEGNVEIDAYLLGALHIRRADQGADFSVCATATDMEVIPLKGVLNRYIESLDQLDS